jgi:hypothetical protein
MAPLPVQTVVPKRQVRRNMEEDKNVIDVVQRSPHTNAHDSADSAFRTWRSGQRHTQKDCIRTIGSLFSNSTLLSTLLEFCHLHVANANRKVIRKILFIYEVHFTCYRDKSTKKPHLYYGDTAQRRAKSNYQHHFSVNVWFGNNGDQLTKA